MAYHHQSNSFISLRYCLVLLCISMIIIQVSQAVNDDLSSSSIEDNNESQLYRRSQTKVAQMLKQILQRGEIQFEPKRFHKFLGRLTRKTADQLKHAMENHI